MSKLLVIFGATGKQGGSVINCLLSDPSTASNFSLRGITRDVSKANSKALAARGVEMVAANLNDKDSVFEAIKGAYGVFAVTDYWATMDSPGEIRQGKSMVDAAKAAGVQHFVLSTLMSPKKFTNGALSLIEHFDGKAEIADYATSVGLPSTFYLPGFYMSNLLGQMFRKDASGNWTFSLPIESDAQIPLTDSEVDTGNYVKSIFTHRDELLGKQVLGSAKYYTPQEIVDAFKVAYPKDGASARFVSTPVEAYTEGMRKAGMSEKAAMELTENMLLLNKKYGYYNGADLEDSNKYLDRPAVTWEEFVKTASAFKDLQ